MKKHSGNIGRVLDYLKKHKKGISSKEAFEKFGATRLSAIVYTLRNEGYVIENEERNCKNRFGEKCNFVNYVLAKEAKWWKNRNFIENIGHKFSIML